MSRHILIVDDEPDILRLLSDTLTYEQFRISTATNGRDALKILEKETVDLVILDIMMPELDGLETIRLIRQKYHMPIILLSARDREIDIVIGLEIGADDYITKPFSTSELVARVKAHFRQMDRLLQWQKKSVQPQDVLWIDEEKYEVYLEGKKMDLSTKEFQLLNYLVKHAYMVLSREQIYQNVWGNEYGDLNTVTVHIKNIRKKLGKHAEMIKTIWGVGYKFIPAGEAG